MTITVFGSAHPEQGSAEYNEAREIGRVIARAGYGVCNGGYGGTMEASARGAKEAGGTTIGVVAESFGTEANAHIDRKVVVRTPVDRLLKLIELGDAYVVLRGGTGTLVELATVWEYMNKQLMKQKPAIAVGEFWAPVVDAVRSQLRKEGNERAAQYVSLVSRPEECVNILKESFKKR